MGEGEAERETPVEATRRRELFAVGAIEQAVRVKAGKQSVHGKFAVILHWKAGQLEQVTVEDSTSYR